MRGLYKKCLFDLIVALTAAGLGVVMLPVFGIVDHFVDILLAAALTIYLIIFLLDKLKHTRGTVFMMTALEFFLLSLVVIWLIIQQFIAFKLLSVCRVIGMTLWMRGIGITSKLYISSLNVKKPRGQLRRFWGALIMISVGVWMFVSPIFSDRVCEWIISISLFLISLIFFALTFLFYPTKSAGRG